MVTDSNRPTTLRCHANGRVHESDVDVTPAARRRAARFSARLLPVCHDVRKSESRAVSETPRELSTFVCRKSENLRSSFSVDSIEHLCTDNFTAGMSPEINRNPHTFWSLWEAFTLGEIEDLTFL